MMRAGLVERTLRETWRTTLVLMVIVGLVSGLLSRALPAVQEQFMKRSFIPPQIQQLRNALMGVESSLDSNVAEVAYAIAWSHPALLFLLLAHAIMFSTRVPPGELERGTMDVLLGLPVSRWTLLVSETIAWMLSAAVLLGTALAGSRIGSMWVKPEYQPDWARMGIVLANLAAVYAAVGALGFAAAACSDKRGRAILLVMVVTLASLVINFLALLWEPMGKLDVLSFLHYYRPALIIRGTGWPWRDLGVLVGVAGMLWVFAGVVLQRRDLTTT